jgi:GntR family transcriptional regulator, galactonate operon transcriptional repressor
VIKRASSPAQTKPATGGAAGKHRSRLAKAVDRLGREIVTGHYPIGSTLPVEAKLCEALGVGRNTLREAVKVLSDKGMLKTARRYGTRVLHRRLWNILDVTVLLWLKEDPAYAAELNEDLTDIRAVLEPLAAQRAAERGASQMLGAEMLEAALRLDGSELEVVFAADLQFHAMLYDGTGSLMLSQFGKLIVSMMEATFHLDGFTVYKPNAEQHIRIAKAILAGDGTGARRETDKLLAVNLRDISTSRKGRRVTSAGTTGEMKRRRKAASSK